LIFPAAQVFLSNASRQAYSEARQLEILAQSQGLSISDDPSVFSESLSKAITSAFADHLALRTSPATLHCRMVGGKNGELRRESVVKDHRLFVCAEQEEMETRGQVKILLSLATAVEEKWLKELFPDDFKEGEAVVYDRKSRAVTAKRTRLFRDLILEEKEGSDPGEEIAARLLAEQVRLGNLHLPKWNRAVEQYVARINFVARHCPDYKISTVDEDGLQILLEQLCQGARRYKEIKGRDPMPFVKQWLSDEQRMALEQAAPFEITLPKRKKTALLRYEDDGKVYLAATIQELYDAPGNSLRIANGAIPITIEILAPNRRPAQITEDLDAFWDGAYLQIKKDLRGRYPKHEWR